MSKQLVVLVSVLLACTLYSSYSLSNLQACRGSCGGCGGCGGGCGGCNIDCVCGPCNYDGQTNSHTGQYNLCGSLCGGNYGTRKEGYSNSGGYGSTECGSGNTKRWGSSKSKSSCYSKQKCDCLNKLKKKCKCGGYVTKICRTSKKSGRKNHRAGTDGYCGNYGYKTNKKYGDKWGFNRDRCLKEKNGYKLKVGESEQYQEAGSGNCLDGDCIRGKSGQYTGYDGQIDNGSVHSGKRTRGYDSSCCLCKNGRRRIGRAEIQDVQAGAGPL